MGRITSFSKQVIVFFLVTALIIRPTFAANVGGWSMGNPVAQGASVVYEGTKNIVLNGADYVKKGTAKITPPASSVAKVLARGGAGYALSVAVEELLGAVDWVLDPANNQITYIDPTQPAPLPVLPEIWIWSGAVVYGKITIQKANDWGASSPQSACEKTAAIYEMTLKSVTFNVNNAKCTWENDGYQYVQTVANPTYDPQSENEQERKTIPLETVAQQVISNAAGGDAAAQQATTAAAADIVAEAQKDDAKARPIAQQLESSAQTKPADEAAAEKASEATGTAKPNTANPELTDLALEFPTFCNWSPIVCEAAQVVITFPTQIQDWVQELKQEYAEKSEENTDTELEIPDLEQDIEVDTDISFGGSCPAPLSSDINFMGLNKTIEFSFDPVCQIAEFIKPVVISISAFSAALIVAGIRTEDD